MFALIITFKRLLTCHESILYEIPHHQSFWKAFEFQANFYNISSCCYQSSSLNPFSQFFHRWYLSHWISMMPINIYIHNCTSRKTPIRRYSTNEPLIFQTLWLPPRTLLSDNDKPSAVHDRSLLLLYWMLNRIFLIAPARFLNHYSEMWQSVAFSIQTRTMLFVVVACQSHSLWCCIRLHKWHGSIYLDICAGNHITRSLYQVAYSYCIMSSFSTKYYSLLVMSVINRVYRRSYFFIIVVSARKLK